MTHLDLVVRVDSTLTKQNQQSELHTYQQVLLLNVKQNVHRFKIERQLCLCLEQNFMKQNFKNKQANKQILERVKLVAETEVKKSEHIIFHKEELQIIE